VAIHHIYGWRWFALSELAHSVERLVLLFRNSIGDYHDGQLTQSRVKRQIWQEALRPLRTLITQGQVVLATDSSRLAAEYRQLIGAELTVFPQPQITVREARTRPFDPDMPFTFGCLGPARLEKGVDLFEEAALAFLKARPDANVSFVLQWTAPIWLADGTELKPLPDLLADPRFHLIDQPMDSATYEEALADIDCMVLPYRRSSYHGRISGVAVEAATAGVPAIYTADTWTADLIGSSGAGIAVQDEDVAGLAQALQDAYDRRAELTAAARARADHAGRVHSLDAFLRCLWGAGSAS
jgi:glycosyltransferase involved in cell wall biosynthesis